jgi:DNA-binding NarL/FixJ family response regulator
MALIRTLVADDHPLFREGVAMLLQAHADIAVVGLARDGLEAVTLAKELGPDVVVMDAEMPCCGGVEATRLIGRIRPSAHVIILAATPSEEHFVAAVEAGVRGYLGKDAPVEALPLQIRAVAGGGAVLAPPLASLLCAHVAHLARQLPARAEQGPRLTRREVEVLRHVARGDSNKEIARDLCIALPTVKNHIHNVLEKLELKELVMQAAQMST